MRSLIFISSFFIFQISHAFTLNSSTNPNLKGWEGGDVQLLVNTSNCPASVDVVGIIQAAVQVWNNVPTSAIKVSYGGSASSTNLASPPTVYCETNFQAVLGADQNAVPGAAAVIAPTGQITQGVLILNVSSGQGNIANFDETTLKIILAHEIGHILGLGHSSDIRALMYYNASAKTELRLAQDDIDGMSYLYPSDEMKNNKYGGCGLVQNLPPPSGGSLLFLFLVMCLPICQWKASRDRSYFKISAYKENPATN